MQDRTGVVPSRGDADTLHHEVRVALVPQADIIGTGLDQPDGRIHILQ